MRSVAGQTAFGAACAFFSFLAARRRARGGGRGPPVNPRVNRLIAGCPGVARCEYVADFSRTDDVPQTGHVLHLQHLAHLGQNSSGPAGCVTTRPDLGTTLI